MRVLGIALLVVGCQEPDDTAPHEAVAACYGYCAAAAAGDGCDTDAVDAACRDECELALFAIPGSCEGAYTALLACLEGVVWVCDGSAERDGLAWPVPEDGACADETSALQECSEA